MSIPFCPLGNMESPLEITAKNDWETYMRRYLRRLYTQRGMAELSCPDNLLKKNQELIRESWKSLVTAIKIDFGPRIVEPVVHEYLNTRFLEISDEIGFERLQSLATSWGLPCEHCVHGKDSMLEDDLDVETLTPKDFIRLNCKRQKPAHSICKLKVGQRFVFEVEQCLDHEPKKETQGRQKILGSLEEEIQEFEKWRAGLSFSEQLLT